MTRNVQPLYLSEADTASRVMGSTKRAEWAGIAAVLERHGLPRIDPMFGGRYWPAVRSYLDRRNGLGVAGATYAVDGEENWD